MALNRISGENVYIGGFFALKRPEAMRKENITHIVSVLQLHPEPDEVFEPYQQLTIPVDDVEDEDLLSHFPTSNAFIQSAIDAGGNVLVHCAMGKSRSATICVAYLLQKHSHHTPMSALALIRESRPFVEPNPGFMKQLELYYEMGCPGDIDGHPSYQRWLYQREVQESISIGRAPEKVRFEDEIQNRLNHESDLENAEVKCKKCRRTLATAPFLLTHTPRTSFTASNSLPEPCAHIFLAPLSWMRPALSDGRLSGRLECPKCKTNVGKFAWQGLKCSCGEWVTPGFMVGRAKVDEVQRGRGGRPTTDGPAIRMPPGMSLSDSGGRKTNESL